MSLFSFSLVTFLMRDLYLNNKCEEIRCGVKILICYAISNFLCLWNKKGYQDENGITSGIMCVNI
jgi:hypothetical protein